MQVVGEVMKSVPIFVFALATCLPLINLKPQAWVEHLINQWNTLTNSENASKFLQSFIYTFCTYYNLHFKILSSSPCEWVFKNFSASKW